MTAFQNPAEQNDRSNPVPINISTQIIIWVITLVFMAGVAYSNFVTRSEFDDYKEKSQQRQERALEQIQSKFDKIMEKIETLQKEKVDKQ